MRVNPKIQEIIAEKVLSAAEEREPSGRISAGKLGWPLQWQMLHTMKIPPRPVDEYTLRKFQRGKDVEERIMRWLSPSEDRMQVAVEYREVVGVADLVLDYPIEVKSATNMAFKHKQKSGPSRSHRLQAELYAKALGHKQCAVAYVASDDYRVLCFEFDVTDEVDGVIDAYDAQRASGIVPPFKEHEKWQAIEDYNPYFEWMRLNEEGIAQKLSALGLVVTGALPLKT